MADYRRNITDDVMEDEVSEKKHTTSFTAFDAKNYLNVKLGANENEKELKIRLLPVDKDTNSPFKTIYMHTIKVAPELASSGWKSYVCLKHTDDINHDELGDKCPFCEMNKIAYDKMKKAEAEENDVERERWKKISLANRYSEVCIIRCIERGAEEDGPKFWKFNVRSDGKDPKSIIKALWKMRKQESIEEAKEENGGELPDDFVPENILDLETGRDLKVTISRVFDKDGRPTNKTSVSIIDYGKNKPISRYEEEVDEWVSDKKVWSDVFVAKPYEYLSIILDGEVPFFDKQNKKWVSKGRARDEEVKKQQREENEANERIDNAKRKALEYDGDDYDNEQAEDDLPY
jgi:hypothetical protein